MIRVVRYHALGPLEAYVNGVAVNLGGPKQRLVLAVLLIEADGAVSDDRLVDELWGEDPPDGARHVIQTYISELRRVLEDRVVRAGRGYRLIVDRSAVDAFRFETLTQAARERLSDSPAAAASMLREALGLWHGEPFGGTGESPLIQREVDRLTELRLAAVEDRIAADLAAGRHAQVTPELGALTREHPFRERLHALYMLALYRSDRQADALLAYHRARRVLLRELGIDPSPDLQALERQILAQDAALAAPPTQAPAGAGAEQASPGTTDPLGAIRGFELRQLVGERGARATFRAYQASVGREVAVAAFRGPFVRRPDFMRSFDHRARTLATLDHPNVLPVLDWWRDPDGGFVVTPWIGGGSVRHALRGGGPWSISRTLRLLEQCGGALSAAHRRRLFHGRITTSDILLDADGNALLAGFAMVDPAHDGPLSGGSARVAPELHRGEPVTARSDIWGLAVAAIEILTGPALDNGAPASGLAQHRNDLPADLVDVLAQGSALAPNERHERLADFLRDVRRAAGADVVAMPVAGREVGAIRNPYKGLRAFEEADAEDFFGRTALIDQLLEAVGQHRFVLLAGPSGSGKSSAIRAGLVPALRADLMPRSDWLITDMFPGAFPFEELEAALLRVGVRFRNVAGPGDDGDVAGLVDRDLPHDSELLLVIDQFEELWSLAEDADARRHFVSALLDAVDAPESRVHVIAALRTDFLDRVLEEARLGEHVRQGLVLVTPPSAEDLARAVVGPARRAGLEFEPGLSDTIVRDVRNEPAALPLLQHALSELFARRDGRRLTKAAYHATGGVTGALGRRAEAVYRSLPPGGSAAARQVFLRLVAVDEQRLDARRRVSRGELRSLPIQQRLVDEVLHQFGAHRLLSFDRDPLTRGPTVEVAHEALFREWKTLREWIESRRDDLLRQRGLRSAAGEWLLAQEESADYLFSGSRLAEAERWRAETDLALSAGEQSFLSASRVREDDLAARRRRRRMVLQAAAGAAGVVVLALAGVSFIQLTRAEAGEREARARALAAASGVQLEVDEDLAVLLGMEAVTVSTNSSERPIPEAMNALHTALLAHRTGVSAHVGGFFVGFAGESLMFSTGGPPGPAARPTIWDPATGEVILQPEPGGALPTGAAIGAGGRLAAETYGDASTVVWDLATGDVVSRTEAAGGIVGVPAISDDGRLLAAARLDPITGQASVEMFDLPSGRLLWSTPTEFVTDLLFGAEDAWLAVATESSAVVDVLDPHSGERLRSLGVAATGVSGLVDLALDPTSEQVALLAYGPSRIEVIDTESGGIARTITLGAEPNAVCFAASGDWIVVSAADELIHVWSVERGTLITTLPGSGHVGGLDCAMDGNRVAVSGDGGITRIFDLRAEVPTEVASFATEPPAGGWWSSDGSLVISHDDGRVRRYAAEGRLLAQTSAESVATPSWIALSPDGRTLAAEVRHASRPGAPAIELFDTSSLAALRTMQGGGLPLAFSADGRLLLAGGDQGGAVYEVDRGNLLARLLSPIDDRPFTAPAGTFLPDGRHVVLQAVGAPEAWIYDVATSQHVGTVCTEEDSIRVALAPSGDKLVVGDHPGWVEAWPVTELLAAAGGAAPACAREGTDPSDAARTGRWELPAEAGLRFDADGRLLATTSGFDGRVAVWDFATEERVLDLQLDGTVSVLGFSPDSRHLAVGLFEPRGSLHAVRILALDPAELVELARARVTRPLSDEECRDFLHRGDCSDRADADR